MTGFVDMCIFAGSGAAWMTCRCIISQTTHGPKSAKLVASISTEPKHGRGQASKFTSRLRPKKPPGIGVSTVDVVACEAWAG